MTRLLETGRDVRVQPWYIELWVSPSVWEDFGARERLYYATEWPGLQSEGFVPPAPPPEDTGSFVPSGEHAGFRRLAVFPTPVNQRIHDFHVRVPPGKVAELEVAVAHHSLVVPEEGEPLALGLQVTVLASTCDWAREGAVEDIALQPTSFTSGDRSIVLDSDYVFKVWTPVNSSSGRNDAGVYVYSRQRGFVAALNVHLLSALKARLSPIYWVSVTGKQYDDMVDAELVEAMQANGGVLDLVVEPVTAKLKKTYNLYKVLLWDREGNRSAFSGIEVCGTSLCLFRTSGVAFIIHDADRTLLFDVARMPRLPAQWREPWTPRDPVWLARKAPRLPPLRCRAIVEQVPENIFRRHGFDCFLLSPAGMFSIPGVSRMGGLSAEVARAMERGEYKFGLHRVCFTADGPQ
ncbi:uncharacterized protein LOC62_07G009767 [Vanrija pseudolonga]|uniref:Uncharacterized protein n=1 Tax=Vanrija pseudolonga TaxID=143232 RepID=A0AAF0YKA6_9TREE|nr:hypothetical protein LOC62_07G009767 [Vanrija pseudolonga]